MPLPVYFEPTDSYHKVPQGTKKTFDLANGKFHSAI